MIDVDELATLANAATPGPWTFAARAVRVTNGPSAGMPVAEQGDFDDDEDMAHIAAANPATVLALIERLRAAEAELETALRVLDHVAPRPWAANLDDPHDEQDSGEYDDGEWVITDASEHEIDRSCAGSRWSDGVTNGGWAREYVADVNALGSALRRKAVQP
jgi:hypothetical protein